MIINNIYYSDDFLKLFKKLEKNIQNIADKKIKLFEVNPLHPSLRLHSLKGNLKGLWSISFKGQYRVIFERASNGDINLYSIGKHDLYKNL
jgi:toxin HigB-1